MSTLKIITSALVFCMFGLPVFGQEATTINTNNTNVTTTTNNNLNESVNTNTNVNTSTSTNIRASAASSSNLLFGAQVQRHQELMSLQYGR